MPTFHHKEGWLVTGNSEAIMRLGVLITRLEMLEAEYGELLNKHISDKLDKLRRQNKNERTDW